MLGFQNRTSDIKLPKFYANQNNNAYLEKYNFKQKLVCQFWNLHWIRGEWVWEWSRILILSLNWPCMQNETKCNCQFYNLSQKMWHFANDFKHRQIIYRWKAFFVTRINSESLSQNKVLFGSYLLANFLFAQKCVSMIRTLSSGNKDTTLKSSLRWTWCYPYAPSKTAE